MKSYTFKLYASSHEVVIACHMQLEQFYDSMKLTTDTFKLFIEKYPDAYLTASDYFTESGLWYSLDSKIGTLKGLIDSKSLKDWMISSDFLDFVDEVNKEECYSEVKNDAEV